jgi:hypothetical protein
VRLTAVVTALVAAAVLASCGEKEERVVELSAGEVQALVAAGLRAGGSTRTDRPPIRFSADGPTLRVRLSEPPPAEGLFRPLSHFSRIHAQIVPFCPKPAILGCKPGLQASGALRPGVPPGRVARALQHLARARYEQRPLVRRAGRGDFDIVTANGELLGAVRTDGRAVRLSFGGPSPPRRAAAARPGRLVVEAGPAALAAMGARLGRQARGALAGTRRLEVVAPL